MGSDLNLKSSTLEKGIEIAANFLNKLIMPAVEETGLLIKDKVTFWKFKNQVKILNKAKDYCEKNRIETKTISFKLLVPLLEASALEEDELLQDKWAILLSNLVDSDQNIENHVFPYILGQISVDEFQFMERGYYEKLKRNIDLEKRIKEYKLKRPQKEEKLKKEIIEVEKHIEEIHTKINRNYPFERDLLKLKKKKKRLQNSIDYLNSDGEEKRISNWILDRVIVSHKELKDFEISNLVRLGLIKLVQETHASAYPIEIPNNDNDNLNKPISLDVEIDVESELYYVMTELGELFITACTDKNKKNT